MAVLVRRAIVDNYVLSVCSAALSTTCTHVELPLPQASSRNVCTPWICSVLQARSFVCRVADGIDGKADGALFVTVRRIVLRVLEVCMRVTAVCALHWQVPFFGVAHRSFALAAASSEIGSAAFATAALRASSRDTVLYVINVLALDVHWRSA